MDWQPSYARSYENKPDYDKQIYACWVLEHSYIKANWMADKLTKQEDNKHFYGPGPIMGVSTAQIKKDL